MRSQIIPQFRRGLGSGWHRPANTSVRGENIEGPVVYGSPIYVIIIELTNGAVFEPSERRVVARSARMTSRLMLVAILDVAALVLVGPGSLRVASADVVESSAKTFRFSAAGDFGAWSGFATSLDALNASESEFALALGDLSYGGNASFPGASIEGKWCGKFRSEFPNVAIVAGNHETDLANAVVSMTNYTRFCPYTLSSPLSGEYGRQYYFDYPASGPVVRFLLISPDLTFARIDGGERYEYIEGNARYNWTRDAIDAARAAGIPWVFVGMHKDCIAAGEHGCEIGKDIMNLLLGRKVDLILEAHNHHYERSKQLAVNSDTCVGIQLHVYNPNCVVNDGSSRKYPGGAGSVIVTAGTGGRELVDFNVSDHFAPYIAEWMGANTLGNGKGIVTFDVSATQISMRTHFNGTYSDTFTIAKPVTGSFVRLLVELGPVLATVPLIGFAALVAWRGKQARKSFERA